MNHASHCYQMLALLAALQGAWEVKSIAEKYTKADLPETEVEMKATHCHTRSHFSRSPTEL